MSPRDDGPPPERRVRPKPSIAGRALVTTADDPPPVTGDDVLDSLASQVLQRIDAEHEEADELYEHMRGLAEGHSDDAAMQRAAIDAFKVKTASTDRATKILELMARVKLANDRRKGPASGDAPSPAGVLEVIDEMTGGSGREEDEE